VGYVGLGNIREPIWTGNLEIDPHVLAKMYKILSLRKKEMGNPSE
jgi:hypothetical protein